MATIEEILSQVGLGDKPSQTKTASAAATPSSKEVNKVLEDLGLGGVEEISSAGVTKTASEERNHMGFTEAYEALFGEEAVAAPAEDGQNKIAAAAPAAGEPAAAPAEGEDNPITDLGELTGIYFNVAEEAYLDKVAGDLEHEAGSGHSTLGGNKGGGELTRIIGKEGDPSVAVNHDPTSGAGLKVNPGNQTPYSLKARAQIKAILKRTMKSEPGDIGGYNE
jgi:hypothetical protein